MFHCTQNIDHRICTKVQYNVTPKQLYVHSHMSILNVATKNMCHPPCPRLSSLLEVFVYFEVVL